MNLEETQKKLNQFFVEKLDAFGAIPEGVDYKNPEAQAIRFEELVKVIDPSQKFTVIDYGSGYGGMFDFLNKKGWDFEYYGIDIIEKMVIAGREAHKDFPNAHFTTNETEVPIADYLLAGSIFNIKMETSHEEWREFTLQTLCSMNGLCSKGFSFNMLTKYSDADRMAKRPDLYFSDPLLYFDFCKRNFSRNVALLHDYGLFDFTILVRKDI
jgi:SAM-dependent methyltransferase